MPLELASSLIGSWHAWPENVLSLCLIPYHLPLSLSIFSVHYVTSPRYPLLSVPLCDHLQFPTCARLDCDAAFCQVISIVILLEHRSLRFNLIYNNYSFQIRAM